MKWIGQHIYDLIARFRNDVYLEDINTGTIASGGNLGLDSNNKIVKATVSSGSGDIESVSIITDTGLGGRAQVASGPASFNILGASGVGVTNSGVTITAVAVPGEIDHDSLLNFAADEHFTQANITTVGTIGTGTWQGTAINQTYLVGQSGTNTGDQTSVSGNAGTATTLATARAINGVNFDGSAAITIPTRVYGSTIKLLPNDFIPNEDGGTSKGVFFDDDGTTGLKPGIAAMELIAIVGIPEGYKATHVDVYDNSHNLVINVYEMNINASGQSSKGSGNANTTLDITDVNATATNYLAIEVVTTATSERVFGGSVTIAVQ